MKPVVIVASLGKPVVAVLDGLPVESVTSLGQPVTVVASLGMPVTFAEDAATTAFVAALSTPPTTARRILYNNLIIGLKSDGVWTGLDWLLILAAEDAQASLVNLKTPSKVATAVSTPTFTADRGYTSDGIAGHLDLGEALNAVGNGWALDSASAGAWINAQGSTSNQRPIGTTAASPTMYITARASAGNETFRVNDATTDTLQANTGSALGHRGMSRTGAAVKRGFHNGVRVADLTSASTAVITGNITVCRSDNIFTVNRIGAVYFGSGMTDAQMLAIHTRLSTFLTAIGAN